MDLHYIGAAVPKLRLFVFASYIKERRDPN